jgi:hypothetical protein
VRELPIESREGEDPAQRGADAGRPGDREGGAGDDRTALARAGEQGVDVPFPVQPFDVHRGDEQHAHRDQEDRADVGEQVLVVAQRLPERRSGQPEQDEDRREGEDEEEARRQDAAPISLLDLADADPGDRRKVARDQRQHARGEERDQSGGEGHRHIGA